MIKGQKSIRGGIEDFLCPFTDMFITQGSNNGFSHRGTMANDVRGSEPGVRYPYYAPCTCKLINLFSDTNTAMWQSLNKVRFANGRVDFATFVTAHDDSFDARIGQVVNQGDQLGNMGMKGFATGVHCHIQISQSNDSSWFKNQYGIYRFNNEYDTDDCYFVDNTNIIAGNGGNWRTTDKVPVKESYTTGLYKCLYDMKVRSGAGLQHEQVKVCDLTADGKKNATSQAPNAKAVYKAGTIFTAKTIISDGDSVWAKSPSGYICIKDSRSVYCEKC